ncbi:MAG: DUF177 domain-containing protein [Andreesenia angusta]|nr:DUF177 domain-containing protein [Andreesenia angusta]
MKLNLEKLINGLEAFLQIDEKLTIDEDRFFNKVLSPVNLRGTIYAGEETGVLSGELIYIFKDGCARCLKETEVEIKENFDLPLIREGREDESSDDTEALYNEDEIFLEEFIYDLIITSSPMKVICSEDCKGLCSNCGADLNEQSCDCETDDVDPRLAKLKELL